MGLVGCRGAFEWVGIWILKVQAFGVEPPASKPTSSLMSEYDVVLCAYTTKQDMIFWYSGPRGGSGRDEDEETYSIGIIHFSFGMWRQGMQRGGAHSATLG